MGFGSVENASESPAGLSEEISSKSQQETKQERRQSNQQNLLLLQLVNPLVFVVDELQSGGDDLCFVAAFSDVHLI